MKIFFSFRPYRTIRQFSVRIGCASGFWGDTNVAVPQLIKSGNLDYLVFDYLSEITMSLLAKMKSKDPTKGYIPDFLRISKYFQDIKSQNLKIIANCGGINTIGCGEEINRLLKDAGVQLNVAVIQGDNIILDPDKLAQLKPADYPQSILSSNVYLGALPIKRALDHGADIVITGRCVDSAIVLGPLWHKYNWSEKDYDKLALGSLAGHIIECGAQATGGIFTDYQSVPDWWNIGFPIVEVNNDTDRIQVTKPPKTGGLVSKGTVSEQLVYEIDDPSRYILPDVICDFRDVQIEEIADNKVEVFGVKGRPPTNTYKVSSTYLDKYRLTGVAILIGSDAVSKAYRTANEILKRVKVILKQLKFSDFSRTNIQVIGAEDSYGALKNEAVVKASREVVIWISAEHSDKRALGILASEIAPAGTGMSPGLTGLIGGRPKISPIVKLHSSYLNKSVPQVTISFNGVEVEKIVNSEMYTELNEIPTTIEENKYETKSHVPKWKLSDLCWARSGDKGDTCNIGVIARTDEAWLIIKERLTVEVVQKTFQHFLKSDKSKIMRYELPGIKALNFVLLHSLGGGGTSSLNIDPQGKAYAQILLDIMI